MDTMLKRIENSFFGEPGKYLAAIFLAVLFLLGLSHWISSFRMGNIPMSIADWPKEKQYCMVLKEAITEKKIPYFISEPVQQTDMFLGLPETMVSPQIVLLKWLTPGEFECFNMALFYTLGFAGCLLIRRRFRLNLLAFTALFLLFNFNGYTVSRMGVGHTQWFSVFLLPCFVLLVFDLETGKNGLKTALQLSLLFFFMLLQGGFHVYVWCVFFLLVYMLTDFKKWKNILLALGISAALSAFRLLPAIVAFAGKNNAGSKGYPSLITLLSAMMIPRDVNFQLYQGAFGWFEYNLFTDITGFAFIALFCILPGILWARAKNTESGPALSKIAPKGLYLTMLVLLFFTFDRFYGVFSFVPFFNSQSAALRMVIIPFVFAVVLAASRFSDFTKSVKNGAAKALFSAGVLLMAGSLIEHAELWKIKRLETLMPPSALLNLSLSIVERDAPVYKTAVLSGYLISLVALLIVVILLIIQGTKKTRI